MLCMMYWELNEDMSAEERLSCLMPVDCLVGDLPRLELDLEAAWQIVHGQSIWHAGLQVGGLYRIYGPDGRFLGMAEVNQEGKVAPRRLLATPL